MRPGRPNGFGAGPPGLTALCAALALLVPPGPVLAAEGPFGPAPDGAAPPSPAASRGWLSVGLLTGSTQFDAELADYQWDTTPRLGWGLSGLVGRGRFAAGLELWRTGTTQAIGDLGAAPEVHATSLELVGEARIVGRWGTDLWVRGHGGRLRLGYQPDRITIQPPGPVSPIEVELAPVAAWIGGAGAALRRPVASRWTVGLGVDARVFAIDTAHRSGDTVVYGRRSFGDWSIRCEIARMLGRR